MSAVGADDDVWKKTVDEWTNLEMRPIAEEDAAAEGINEFADLSCVSCDECWESLKSGDLSAERKKVQMSNPSAGPVECCAKCETRLRSDLDDEKEIILALTKVPFVNKDQVHNRMLFTLFRRLKPKGTAPTRCGSHWELIGFQGDDPATDLRGAGIFGLLQLLFFVCDPKYKNDVDAIFDLAQDEIQNFPFAIVGLNFTRIVLTALRKRRLNKLANRKNSVLFVCNSLYAGIFCYFYNIWTQHPKKSIENFGFVFQQIEKAVNKTVSKVLKAKTKVSSNKEQIRQESIEFDKI